MQAKTTVQIPDHRQASANMAVKAHRLQSNNYLHIGKSQWEKKKKFTKWNGNYVFHCVK